MLGRGRLPICRATVNTYGQHNEGTALPLTTRLGAVRIGVTSAERALSVWRELVGLEIIVQNAQEIGLSARVSP